jgi:protein-disulfide isomerase
MSPSDKPYSLRSFLGFLSNNFVVLLIAAIMFGGGFFSGSLWTENSSLKSGSLAQVKGTGDVAAPVAAGDTGPTADQLAAVPEVGENEHIRGSKDAKITLVEYSDFECPFCGRFHPTMQQVMEEFGDDVRWVYRQYPLSFHPNAQKAAEGSECVAKLGGNDAFWKYADSVFGENLKAGQISPEVIEAGATSAGVNIDDFKKCLDSDEMAETVKAQMDAASTSGVSGTPGTFIVTEDGAVDFISGALPFEQVKVSVEKYL